MKRFAIFVLFFCQANAHASFSTLKGMDFLLSAESDDQITLSADGKDRANALRSFFTRVDFAYGFKYKHMLAVGTTQAEVDLAAATLRPIARGLVFLNVQTQLVTNVSEIDLSENTLVVSGSADLILQAFAGMEHQYVLHEASIYIRHDMIYSINRIPSTNGGPDTLSGPFYTPECVVGGDTRFVPILQLPNVIERVPCR